MVKGLILKEMRQTVAGLVTTLAILIIYLPWMILNAYSFYLKGQGNIFEFDLMDSSFSGMVWIIPFILAIGQLGSEKQRGSMDFTLSLPYSRSTIYWGKWLIGLAMILIGLIISYLISSGIFFFTNAVVDDSMLLYYCNTFVSALLLYSLVFAAGCLTGTSFAQGLVAGSMLILPGLTVSVISMNLAVFVDSTFYYDERVMEVLSLFTGINSILYTEGVSTLDIFIPLVLILIYTAIGYFTFIHHPVERNGYFFLWKGFNLPVFILVLLLGMFGFAGFGFSIGGESMIGYFSGLLIGAGVGAGIGYYTIYKKAK
ncbi:ABC transporter permease subunit [Metabacillus sp. KIGAM252]|uniref:ABC transporter permease subunit n=1 Tax=Metabacillus flavus TaxID=2823519 RepID=A0ABS5LH90_9BACI|nr:ABC transporter permease subunit [Metabacillus flavus]MBS2970119.1 ABC transporter permease subunit [Metabacillus flavus]